MIGPQATLHVASEDRVQVLLLLLDLELPRHHIERLAALHRIRQPRNRQRDAVVCDPVLRSATSVRDHGCDRSKMGEPEGSCKFGSFRSDLYP